MLKRVQQDELKLLQCKLVYKSPWDNIEKFIVICYTRYMKRFIFGLKELKKLFENPVGGGAIVA